MRLSQIFVYVHCGRYDVLCEQLITARKKAVSCIHMPVK